jgi:succinoglycan biosynthesis protein ExoM
MQYIVVGVCTCKRPKMLANCLKSLAEQIVDPSILMEVLVVDNEESPNNRPIYDAVSSHSPHRMHYVHQPRRGISFARNTVLDKASEFGADWIAFIDDDETADPHWVAELLSPEYCDTAVLEGRQCFVHPEAAPFWFVAKPALKDPAKEGTELKTTITANVRFSIKLVEAGLRFNEDLGFMGGEDVDFFTRAREIGFKIKHTSRAVTHEVIHVERVTLLGYAYRQYWYGAADILFLRNSKGIWWVLGRKVPAVVVNIIFGVVEMMISPLFLLRGHVRWRRQFLRGMKKMMKASGRAAALIGFVPRPYRNIVGS